MGRVVARISNGQFSLNDATYTLDKNDGKHTLHGGKNGFTWVKIFDCKYLFWVVIF